MVPNSIDTVNDKNFIELHNLKKLEQFNIIQKHNINSTGYKFHLTKSNNRLVLYHQGHSGDFLIGKKTIAYFLNKGFTIYSFAMPLKERNNRPIIEIPKIGKIHLLNC